MFKESILYVIHPIVMNMISLKPFNLSILSYYSLVKLIDCLEVTIKKFIFSGEMLNKKYWKDHRHLLFKIFKFGFILVRLRHHIIVKKDHLLHYVLYLLLLINSIYHYCFLCLVTCFIAIFTQITAIITISIFITFIAITIDSIAIMDVIITSVIVVVMTDNFMEDCSWGEKDLSHTVVAIVVVFVQEFIQKWSLIDLKKY